MHVVHLPYAPGVNNANAGYLAVCVVMARCTLLISFFPTVMPIVATAQEELLSSLGLDVTVTRREDATFAPNGYIYNIYFDGETQVSQRPKRRQCVPLDDRVTNPNIVGTLFVFNDIFRDIPTINSGISFGTVHRVALSFQ